MCIKYGLPQCANFLNNGDGDAVAPTIDDPAPFTYFMIDEIFYNAFISFVRKHPTWNYGVNGDDRQRADILIKKCIEKRAISFLETNDFTLLRESGGYATYLPWNLIGDDDWHKASPQQRQQFVINYLLDIGKNNLVQELQSKDPQFLKYFDRRNYLTYDEMQLCALLMIGGPTKFYNDGSRLNKGKQGEPDTYQPNGYIVGGVGPRFEKPGFMDHKLMIMNNGNNDQYEMIRHIYGGIAANTEQWNGENGVNVNVGFLRQRYKITYKTYLNYILYIMRGQIIYDKKAYVSMTGLGAGAWAINGKEQSLVIVQEIIGILNELNQQYQQYQQLPLNKYIDTIDFQWFDYHNGYHQIDTLQCSQFNNNGNGKYIAQCRHSPTNINITFSMNNPSKYVGTKFEIFQLYAWDSNSLPGNEWWLMAAQNYDRNTLTLSGDPAAASSSQIIYRHNPLINAHLHKFIRIFKHDGSVELHPL